MARSLDRKLPVGDLQSPGLGSRGDFSYSEESRLAGFGLAFEPDVRHLGQQG